MEPKAYPIKGFAIAQSPEMPTIAIFELRTEAGTVLYAATADMLRQIAEDFQAVASGMPRAN